MLNKRVEKALNEQLNVEIAASQRYLDSAAYCHFVNLKGFAEWFSKKAEGSRGTAMHYMQYISERGGKAEIGGQRSLEGQCSSIYEAVESALRLEEERTRQADELHDLARSENDRPTALVIEKFVISSAPARLKAIKRVLQHLKMTEGNNTGLIMIDQSLAG